MTLEEFYQLPIGTPIEIPGEGSFLKIKGWDRHSETLLLNCTEFTLHSPESLLLFESVEEP